MFNTLFFHSPPTSSVLCFASLLLYNCCKTKRRKFYLITEYVGGEQGNSSHEKVTKAYVHSYVLIALLFTQCGGSSPRTEFVVLYRWTLQNHSAYRLGQYYLFIAGCVYTTHTHHHYNINDVITNTALTPQYCIPKFMYQIPPCDSSLAHLMIILTIHLKGLGTRLGKNY